MHPAMQELSQLPVSERLTLVQELWDSIDETRTFLPESAWYRELLAARLADIESGSETGLSRDEVWEEVDRRLGS